MWPNGLDEWCNMEGRYVTIVADYSSVKDTYGTLMPSICDLGIFGTRYVRDSEAPESIELFENAQTSFIVEHIYSEYRIGNTLNIGMLQNAADQLSFVTLVP